MKKRIFLTIAVLLTVMLAGCHQDAPVETTEPIRELTLVVTDSSIADLEGYPALEKADLTGSTCYAAIEDYIARHPEVAVTYTVSVGTTQVSPDLTELELAAGTYDYDTLSANLPYLQQLTSLRLPDTDLTAAQLTALQEQNTAVQIEATVLLGITEVDPQVTTLDLSAATPDQAAQYAAKLPQLSSLTAVELMSADGTSQLSPADVKLLMAAAPGAQFHYSFDLFGTTVTTADEKVELVDVQIGAEGEHALRAALDILPQCGYFLLDNCGMDNDALSQLCSDYPDAGIVWRVYIGQKSWLTDTQSVRAVNCVDNTSVSQLQYLTKVKYLDLGSNPSLSDIGFLSNMPELEILILSGSAVSDLSSVAGCADLELLELARCEKVTDISPLSACKNLKYLNLGHTGVRDLSALKELPLERLSYVNSSMTESDWQTVRTQHPDCLITSTPLNDANASPYGKGWRYNDDNSYTDCYQKIRDVFGYDKLTEKITDTNAPTSTPSRKVTMTVTADSISKLEQYTYLEEADLTGSTCYDAILNYMAAHPAVDVYFTVPLGGTTVENTTTSLVLKQGSFDYATLKKNLKYITELEHLTLPSTNLTAQQLSDLRGAYPALDISYTMSAGGGALNATARAVDLSGMTSAEVDSIAQQLLQYPNIVYAELMNGGKSNLTISDVKKLQDACPNVVFHYSFDLFGKTVSTTDDTIKYENVSIGNKGESAIRSALDILDGCTYFLLDDCGIDYHILADIREDYPNTKVVWRVHQTNKGRSWLTDTKVLRAVYGINDDNSYVLRYCNEVKYMDLGHNTEMVDISFCAYMPDLEIAILSGAPIADLSPLTSCKKLEFLEIAWCGYISDVSPLAQCDGLRYLNIGHTRVKDLSCLDGLDLLMLSYVNSGNRVGFTEADWEEIQTMFPDCWITYSPLKDNDATPYSKGWRYKATSGYTEIYRKVRDVFGYDEIDKKLQG